MNDDEYIRTLARMAVPLPTLGDRRQEHLTVQKVAKAAQLLFAAGKLLVSALPDRKKKENEND